MNSREELFQSIQAVISADWIETRRHGNVGGVGNTIEDLLGIPENNFRLPDAGEYELKCKRRLSTSLITLFHCEPFPRKARFVPRVLLPLYGWQHELAGIDYPENERSFRQTINPQHRTDRGFGVAVDRVEKRVIVSFDHQAVAARHSAWLEQVEKEAGLDELSSQPYWPFDNLEKRMKAKMKNMIFLLCRNRRVDGRELFNYDKAIVLEELSFELFVNALEDGNALVDFDARTGHNHGTKFRMRGEAALRHLYSSVFELA